MSALWNNPALAGDPARRLVGMTAADVDAVMAVETNVYPFPWSRGNFIDSIAAGHVAELLRVGLSGPVLGYCVAMSGAGEMHLLNITVAPSYQQRGHARFMIDGLVERCRRGGDARLWLEVRESNAPARAAYLRLGFLERGQRPGYYPAAHGKRESAIVMSLEIDMLQRLPDALE